MAISNGYWDAHGNRGVAANATFTVDTSVAAPSFDPAGGTVVTDASGNVTLTFAEAIYKDASQTALANTDLAGLLTLKRTDENGAAINFTATIDAAKTEITLVPSADLPEGPVYVAISNGYFDAQGNRGAAANATFTVDTSVAAPVFDPTGGTVVTDATEIITLTFGEAIYKDASQTALANTDLAGLLTLKAGSASGVDITFTATINAAKTEITLDPSADLEDGPVYVAITDGYFDAHGNRGVAANATFTVDTSVAAPVFDPTGGTVVTDASGNVTLTFAEAIYKDASQTALANTDLAGLLTLKTGSASGVDITFTATIDAAKTEITLDPSADLEDGAVYVAITDGYFDAHGNRGAAANATFTVDTSVAAPVFDPAGGTTANDATGNVTLTFGEAIYKDASQTALANSDLAGLLTLKTGSASGVDITFTATIDAAKTEITLDPSADLEDGAVYVAITDGYFDAQGNRGAAANATFTVDTSVAAPVFDPAGGTTVSDATGNVTLTFGEAIRKDADGTALANADLGSLLTLKTDDENGAAIAFTATIDNAKRVITIDPSSNLEDGAVYVAITDGYFDAQGNRGAAANATFTVDTSVATPSFDPVGGTTVTVATGNVTLTFGEAIYKDASQTALANIDLSNLLTLKKTDENGAAITFTAAPPKKVITTRRLHGGRALRRRSSTRPAIATSRSPSPTIRKAARNWNLPGLLTLKTGSASGADIGFAATIDAASG